MSNLMPTASYRQKAFAAGAMTSAAALQESSLSTTDQEVFAQLTTPQTLSSLTRSLRDAHPRGSQPDAQNLERALRRLLDADLIELSPDS